MALVQAHRHDRGEEPAGRVVPHDGRVADALDQLAPDARVDRRRQAEPQARQAGRQHGHRDQPAFQAPLRRVLPHEVAVRHLVGAADLHGAPLARVQVEGGEQVGDEVLDRDRLRLRLHPAGADHDGQALDERPDELERQAPRAEDDRGAQLDDRDARGGPEHVARLLPAAEVGREARSRLAEAAEVDDLPHPRGAGRLAEVPGGEAILLLERGARRHRVNQVVRRVDARERRVERLAPQAVARDDLGARGDPGGQALRPPGEAAHAVAALRERAQEPAADVAGRARQEDQSGPGVLRRIPPSSPSYSPRRRHPSRTSMEPSRRKFLGGPLRSTRESGAGPQVRVTGRITSLARLRLDEPVELLRLGLDRLAPHRPFEGGNEIAEDPELG